jgi:hypothetical protein
VEGYSEAGDALPHDGATLPLGRSPAGDGTRLPVGRLRRAYGGRPRRRLAGFPLLDARLPGGRGGHRRLRQRLEQGGARGGGRVDEGAAGRPGAPSRLPHAGVLESPHLWPELRGFYGPEGPLNTNLRLWGTYAGELLEVRVEDKHLVVRALAGPLRKGARLYPTDPSDPLAFEVLIEGQTHPVVFRREHEEGCVNCLCRDRSKALAGSSPPMLEGETYSNRADTR